MTRVLKFRQDARPCGPRHRHPIFSHVLRRYTGPEILLDILDRFFYQQKQFFSTVEVYLYPPVAETAMGKPLFKASDGGQIDIVREREDVTKGELQ